MKTTLFATLAILGLAIGGAAIVEQAHRSLQQLAASGLPQSETDLHATDLAQGTNPSGNGSRASTQLAASGKPGPQTDEHGTQYAASGLPQADTSRPSSV